MSLTYHDFTTYPLGVPVGYVGSGFDADWEIVDIPSVGRRLFVPNYPSNTWLQTNSAIITSAVLEFEAQDNNAFYNIAVGIRANGVELCSFTHSDLTLRCATYGSIVITDPIPPRLRLEVEVIGTQDAQVIARLRDADTNALLGSCSDSMFGTLTADAFGMFVSGYPAGITATIKKFGWQIALVLSEFSNVLTVQLEDKIGPYEQFQSDNAPPWLKQPRGFAWLASHGVVKDIALFRLLDAVSVRWVDLAPNDALAYLGSDRLLERYPQETDAVFRARIKGVWEVYPFAGTEFGLKTVLEQAGWYATLIMRRYTNVSEWAEFDVFVYPKNATVSLWDTMIWDSGTWDYSNAGVPQDSLRRIINDFKAAHSKLRDVGVSDNLNPFQWDISSWDDGSNWVNPTAV